MVNAARPISAWCLGQGGGVVGRRRKKLGALELNNCNQFVDLLDQLVGYVEFSHREQGGPVEWLRVGMRLRYGAVPDQRKE